MGLDPWYGDHYPTNSTQCISEYNFLLYIFSRKCLRQQVMEIARASLQTPFRVRTPRKQRDTRREGEYICGVRFQVADNARYTVQKGAHMMCVCGLHGNGAIKIIHKHTHTMLAHTKKVIKCVRHDTQNNHKPCSSTHNMLLKWGVSVNTNRAERGDKVAGHHNFQAFDLTIYVRMEAPGRRCLWSCFFVRTTHRAAENGDGRTHKVCVGCWHMIRVGHPQDDNCTYLNDVLLCDFIALSKSRHVIRFYAFSTKIMQQETVAYIYLLETRDYWDARIVFLCSVCPSRVARTDSREARSADMLHVRDARARYSIRIAKRSHRKRSLNN